MSSPFNVFRKHQKAILAVVCVICMVVFTVDMGLRNRDSRGGRGGVNAVVVSWKYGSITQGELDLLRARTQSLTEFLSGVQRGVQASGGRPKAPLVEFLDLRLDDRSLVNSLMLSKRAEELGISLGDDAMLEFLRTLSDDQIKTQSDLATKLADLTAAAPRSALRDFRVPDVFYILRIQLEAAQMRMLATSGISTTDERFPAYVPRALPVSPAAAYEYYVRFNRKIKTEFLPLRVEDFVDQVTQTPNKSELEKLYDEHKNDYPFPESPEPGFKHRARAQFAYVKIPFEPFVVEASKSVTEEQIKEYYDKNKENFRKLDLLTSPDDLKPDSKPAPEVKPEGAKPDAAKPDSAKPGETKPEPTKPDAAKPAETKPEAAKPEAGKTEAPAAPAPEKKPVEPAPTTEPAKPEEKKPEEKKPAEAPKVSRAASPDREVFVLAEGDEKTQPAAAKPEEKKAEDTKPAAAPPAAPEKPAEAKPEAAPPAAPKAEEKPAEPKAGEKSAEPKAGEKPAELKVGEKPAEPKAGAKPAEKPVEYKTLAEVRGEIVKTLAKFPAQQAFAAALSDVRNEVTEYASKYTQWKVRREKETQPPPFPSLAELLKKYHAVQGETGMIDDIEAASTEMAKLHIQFTRMVAQPGILLYRPQTWGEVTSDPEVFVYWKTAEDQKAFTPPFAEAEPEVLKAWKMKQALVLAKAKAEEIAKAAREEKGPLKTALPADMRNRVIDTNEFSWMESLGGFGRSNLGTVAGVNSAGEEFMRAVCSLKYNEIGVAVNQPQTEVYVVRVSSESPTAEELRKGFSAAGLSFTSNEMATHEMGQLLQQWVKEMETDMKLTWKRDPQVSRDEEG